MRRLEKIFIISYIFWFFLLFVFYWFIPVEYPVVDLSELGDPTLSKEVLSFLYVSLLTKISTWYQGLIGCIFGIFGVISLLSIETTKLPNSARLVLTVLGITIAFLTEFFLFKALMCYNQLCIIEKSYILDEKTKLTISYYFHEVNAKASGFLEPFTIGRMGPKGVFYILGAGWLIFIWPAIYLILRLHKKEK